MNSTPSCSEQAPLRTDTAPSTREARQDRELLGQIRSSALFFSFEEAFQTTTGLPLVLRQSGAFDRPFEGGKNASPFCSLMTAGGRSCAACLTLHQEAE